MHVPVRKVPPIVQFGGFASIAFGIGVPAIQLAAVTVIRSMPTQEFPGMAPFFERLGAMTIVHGAMAVGVPLIVGGWGLSRGKNWARIMLMAGWVLVVIGSTAATIWLRPAIDAFYRAMPQDTPVSGFLEVHQAMARPMMWLTPIGMAVWVALVIWWLRSPTVVQACREGQPKDAPEQ